MVDRWAPRASEGEIAERQAASLTHRSAVALAIQTQKAIVYRAAGSRQT